MVDWTVATMAVSLVASKAAWLVDKKAERKVVASVELTVVRLAVRWAGEMAGETVALLVA